MFPIKNFTQEVQVYRGVLTDEVKYRVLTVHGISQIGKSALLSQYREISKSSNCSYAVVNLQRLPDPHAILDSVSEQIGSHLFPHYEQISQKLVLADGLSIKNAVLFFSSLRASKQVINHEALNRHLTREFFKDLISFTDYPLSVLVDQYEVATDETKRWISAELLPRIRMAPRLIITVAGQVVPVCDGDITEYHKDIILNGIGVNAWVEFANDLGGLVSRNEIELIYLTLNGVSGLIAAKILELTKLRKQG